MLSGCRVQGCRCCGRQIRSVLLTKMITIQVSHFWWGRNAHVRNCRCASRRLNSCQNIVGSTLMDERQKILKMAVYYYLLSVPACGPAPQCTWHFILSHWQSENRAPRHCLRFERILFSSFRLRCPALSEFGSCGWLLLGVVYHTDKLNSFKSNPFSRETFKFFCQE